jgi:hypothetical protein
LQYLKYAVIPIILGIIIISCEKDDSTVIDPILHFPTLSNPTFTPSTFDSDTIDAVATAQVSSEEPIRQVSVTLVNPDGVGVGAFELKDDGVSPDVTAGDGIYSARVLHIQNCRVIGDNWKAEFLAENESSLFSPIVNENFNVTRTNNQPPIVSNLIINPDSLQAGDTAIFVFKIRASDPNGQCDIPNGKVFYNGTDPNGGQLTPRELYDDGGCCILPPFNTTSGDQTAGDSIYTRTFLGYTQLTGYFRYNLKAVDRSGDTSNVLTDSIYVYP